MTDLQNWFRREAFAFVRTGTWRPGYNIVRQSILHCVPGATDLWYDGDRAEIVLTIDEQPRTFSNLSAGQRMMVALIGDIAFKVITQNSHLVADYQQFDSDEPLPEVLQLTPGLVLMDEIYSHLHPKWQRRVVGDLKNLFPEIQFVCISYSPFIIQSLEPDELRTLDESCPLFGRKC